MARGGLGVTIRRSWRTLRSKPAAVQVLALLLVIVVVGGVVVGVAALAGSGDSSSSGSSAPASSAARQRATTSARGVGANAITVVFPVIDLSAIANATGLSSTNEKSDEAIHTYVDAINAKGGINGRMIDARIVKYNPYDDADMRSKCKDWTESENVFAVVDGIGSWAGDEQLCITQEGQTPLISDWTSVTDFAKRANPYLRWTGPDQALVLDNLVQWAKGQGLLRAGEKYGVVAGNRASDRLALTQYLEPALKKAGLATPQVETLDASTSDPATVQAQAPVAVQRLEAAGIETVIPLLPFNALQPYLSAATQQGYFPKLLVSDYESSVSLALGLAELQYPGALDGQIGPTVFDYGNQDHPSGDPAGYVPGGQTCYRTWRAAHPSGPDPEAQGPIMRWCQAITLFADVAKKAGTDLNRRTFTDAFATVSDVPGALTPTLSYGPDRYGGPSEYRVVKIHKNDRSHNECPGLQDDGQPHGSCWLIVKDFQPMRTR